LTPGIMRGYTDDVVAHQGVLEAGVHFPEKPFTARTLAGKAREAREG
jgi:two-component system cell cycle sensor histidine kinase/response regulator CckA